jgi:cystathionine gamma-lyase
MVTLGVAYTNDKETLDTITEERAKIGTYLQPMDEALLPDQLAATMRETVRRQATNALALATYLEGKPGIREVSHPNLPTHEDHELAGRLAPEGLVTLFYIAVDDPMGFVDKVKAVAGDVIEIGVSFGHEKTRLLPHSKNGDVRIAAGSEDEAGFARVMESFKIALADNQ